MPEAQHNLDHYTIFCGGFNYSTHTASPTFLNWVDRIPKHKTLLEYLKKTYLPSYYNLMLAGENKEMIHETNATFLSQPITFSLPDGQSNFRIEFFDRYLFQDGTGVLAYKVTSDNDVPIERITNMIGSLRDTSSQIKINDATISIQQFIEQHLLAGLTVTPQWGNQLSRLKHYTIVDSSTGSSFDEHHDNWLFEMGHVIPIGTVASKGVFSPAPKYYQEALEKKTLSPFTNWKAMALLDGFTRLSINFPDEFNSWENDYLQVYVFALYQKFALLRMQDQYKLATLSKKKAAVLKQQFESFMVTHATPTIAHKFLPNQLFEKIVEGLEISEDIHALEKKMNRLLELAEQNSKALQPDKTKMAGAILPGYDCDILISYQRHDNKTGWVTEFVEQLNNELATLIKYHVHIYFTDELDETLVKPVLLIPIISHTYCNPSSTVWKNEMLSFKEATQQDRIGMQVKLKTGNVTNRVLPIFIHEVEEEDYEIFRIELGFELRGIEFIYKEAGVNRPLLPTDSDSANVAGTSYRNQINKLANGIKETLKALKVRQQVS